MPERSDDSPATQVQDTQLEIAKAELRKLNLEIAEMERKGGWWEQIARFIPIITAAISIAGFLWGVYLFRDQQERDRVTREAERMSKEQSQLRAGSEQLLQFSSNQNMTVARVLSLRQDLDALIDSLYPPAPDGTTSKSNQKERENLKKYIFEAISRDFDFTQTRHVQFDIAALEHWDDYKKGMGGGLNNSILEKYFLALAYLRAKNRGLIESIRITEGEEQEPDTLIGDPLRSVILGFVCHFKLLSPEDQARKTRRFIQVTGNESLALELTDFKCPGGVPRPILPST